MKATAVAVLSPKQRAGTGWKLILHSGEAVKGEGRGGTSLFFMRPPQFVASGKDGSTSREYLMALLFGRKGGETQKNDCVHIINHTMINLFNSVANERGGAQNQKGTKPTTQEQQNLVLSCLNINSSCGKRTNDGF